MASRTDRFEKRILLRAPRSRVWRAIGDAKAFGSWFGLALDGQFVAGRPMTARIVPTTVDPEVAKLQKPFEGVRFEIAVERVEPERSLAFRWHPGPVEPGVDERFLEMHTRV